MTLEWAFYEAVSFLTLKIFRARKTLFGLL